jgi:peptidoglycan-N-acetylglucosamine deacetylase
MRRAMGLKLLAAVVIGVLVWAFDGPVLVVSLFGTVLAFIGLVAWGIVAPSSQLFVPSVSSVPGVAAAVAFTFDDGPDPVTTPAVLQVLARHGAKATFFVVGSRAAEYPALVRRIVAEGHALGSHTFHHSNRFHFSSPGAMREEIVRGVEAVRAITGIAPVFFRPPQGLRTPMLRDALRSLPELTCVMWRERGLDAMGRQAPAIVERLTPALERGAIITLHDGGGFGGTTDRAPTLEALEALLALAARRGLACVSLERPGSVNPASEPG